MSSVLDVYIHNTLVGCLRKDNSTLTFQYTQDFLLSNLFPISASMPKTDALYEGCVVESFFQGLLPDSGVKKAIARILQTDETNTFKLLEEIGADCAGAISLYSQGSSPANNTKACYKKIDDDDAFNILSNLKRRPLYIGEDDFRVSGAGAQDKLVACLFDNTLHLPLFSTPSTHIIKPNISGFTDTTFNELFCMKLAKLCGLEAPNCFIKTIQNTPFYVVERYDRRKNGDEYERIHQEDFCQILNVLPENKYESDGGPTYRDCFRLLDTIGVSGKSKIAFLDTVIFNYLIGNGDAHAKNFSILYDKAPELAPCYDLMCTAILFPYYPKVKMAMKLNSKKYEMSKVTREKFSMISDISGYRKDFILKRLDRMCNIIQSNAETLAKDLNKDVNTKSAVYDKIITIIVKHCENVSE